MSWPFALRARLGALLVVGVLGQAGAAPVDVTLSTDGSDDGRLSLSHWPPNGWSVQTFKNFVEVEFPDADLVIQNLDQVRKRLPPALAAVDVERRGASSVFRLTLTCACDVSLHGDGQSGLFIEFDGEPGTIDPSMIAPVAMGNDAGGSVPPVQTTGQITAQPVDQTAIQNTGPDPIVAPMPRPKGVPSAADRPAPVMANGEVLDVDAARERLLQQLLRAAETGIVKMEPDPSEPEEPVDPAAVAGVADSASPTETAGSSGTNGAMPGPEVPVGNAASDQGQIEPADVASAAAKPPQVSAADPQAATKAEHPSDRHEAADQQHADTTGDAHASAEPPIPLPEPVCYPNEALALPEFADADAFSTYIAEHRRTLVGEFDRVNADAAVMLVRGYLVGGLGVEAHDVLSSFAPEHELTPVLRELADVVEGQLLPAEASIMRPDCVGGQALWRAYLRAKAGDGKSAAQDEAAAGRALERLPLARREEVASWIGFAAAGAGEWDAARRLQAMAQRAGRLNDTPLGRTHLLSARLAEWRGDRDEMREHLEQARLAPGVEGIEALFRLGDLALDGTIRLGEDTSDLQADFGALALRHRGEDIGVRAFEMEVRLFDRMRSHEEAIALLAGGVETGLFPQDRHYSLLSDLVTVTKPDENEEPLAMTFLSSEGRLDPALDQAGFRRELVLSMIDLGTPALSDEVMRPGDLSDPVLAGALAQAYLDAGDPREALETAGHLPEGAVKERILGQALLLTGRPEQALDHLMKASQEPEDDLVTRLAVLEAQAHAARQSGDLVAEFVAREAQLELSPTPVRAEQLGLVALQQGAASLPPRSVEILSEAAPKRLAILEMLFSKAPFEPDEGNPAQVTTYLDQLETEAALIEELLKDG